MSNNDPTPAPTPAPTPTPAPQPAAPVSKTLQPAPFGAGIKTGRRA